MEQNEVTHKNPHLWMIVTLLVVTLSVAGIAVYVLKFRSTQPTSTQPRTEETSSPQQISEELKQVDLAELKASIGEIQSILKAF